MAVVEEEVVAFGMTCWAMSPAVSFGTLGTFTVLCKEYWGCKDFWKLADDDKNDEYLDRTASKFVDEYKEGNWTRLYKYNGDWGLQLNNEKCPAHKMSATICVGIKELEVVE